MNTFNEKINSANNQFVLIEIKKIIVIRYFFSIHIFKFFKRKKMSQTIFQIQRSIPDVQTLLQLMDKIKENLKDELVTQTPVLLVIEAWRRKIMKESNDLWFKSVSKIEHLKFEDFETTITGLTKKQEELKEDDTCEYELFIEAIIVYLKPIQEIFDEVSEPPLQYNSTSKTNITNDEWKKIFDTIESETNKTNDCKEQWSTPEELVTEIPTITVDSMDLNE